MGRYLSVSWGSMWARRLLANGPLLVLAAMLIIIAALAPSFYGPSNLTNVLRQVGILGIVAVGQTLVILGGGVDLSVGAVMSVSLVTAATITQGRDGYLPEALAATFGFALIIGAINGLLVTWRRVPPFVATLATLLLIEGAILAYTGGALSGQIPPFLDTLGTAKLGPITYSIVLFGIAAVAGAMVLRGGAFGRALYATGLNRETARLSGIHVDRVTFATYIISALCAAAGGLLLAGYVGYVDQYVGQDLNLDSIAAVIVGGTSFAGGRGGIGGTVIGVVLLSVLVNVVFVANVPTPVQLVLKGLVIVGAVVMYQLTKARSAGVEAARV
jgi:ribose/xylose/arabinose/galactoside ABC-type transport system permease subunit